MKNIYVLMILSIIVLIGSIVCFISIKPTVYQIDSYSNIKLHGLASYDPEYENNGIEAIKVFEQRKGTIILINLLLSVASITILVLNNIEKDKKKIVNNILLGITLLLNITVFYMIYSCVNNISALM